MQATARYNGNCRVARLLRSAILRLKQIDVSAAGHIEGMLLRTNKSSFLWPECQMAVADGTEEHP